VDERAWHVLAVEAGGHVRGCVRYLAHDPDVSFSDLVIRNSALAQNLDWRGKLRRAVEADVALATFRRKNEGRGADRALRPERETDKVLLF